MIKLFRDMKRYFTIIIAFIYILATGSCSKVYILNTDFTSPVELASPSFVALDVSSSEPVVLSWTGGGASDGGIILYNVLFDKENGDYSKPLAVMKSDQGAANTLTLTHAELNALARSAGILPEGTGTIKWTVSASKGGVVKIVDKSAEIKVTRGEGIDNIPDELYLYGGGAEVEGQRFRKALEGRFIIYSKIKSGKLTFKSSKTSDAHTYYIDSSNKLREGEGEMNSPLEGLARLILDFNTMSLKVETVAAEVRCIWGATYANIAVLSYKGQGLFQGEGDIIFIDPSRPETNPPSWLGWTEERYYFIAKVNDKEVCWGRGDNISPERPVGGEPAQFYELHEFEWVQWEHLWKMSGDLDKKRAAITINTDSDGLFIHSFTNITSI